MSRAISLLVLLCLYGSSVVSAQPARTPAGHDRADQSKPAGQVMPAQEKSAEQLTEAERIMNLQRTIEQNEKLLEERKAKLDDPQSEYGKAEAEFKELDRLLEDKKKELKKLEDEGRQEAADKLRSEVEDLQKRWQLARERFDLAIKERKTLQEQTATLEQKLQQDKETLKKLLAPPATQPAAATQPATTPAQPTEEAAKTEPTPAEKTTPIPVIPGLTPVQPAQEQPAEPGVAKPPTKEVIDAQKEAQAKAAAAEEAKDEVTSLSERIGQQQKLIEAEKTALETARKKAANAEETRRTLAEQLQKRSAEGAPQAEVQELWTKITEARRRAREAQAEVDKHVDRIDQLQDELQKLQQEHIAALEKERQAEREKEEAEKKLAALQNPLAPRNIAQWVLNHGPKVVGILVAMVALLWLARFLEKRLVGLIAGRGGPGTAVERENRAKTLVSVFHHAATIAISVGGVLMILSEVGLPIGPLLGGAAVVGLAVAFGAQNLVRDYFTGFMILMENQYSINDVIKVAGVAGLVEGITLRVTILRDLEGVVHFVPNGQITTVSNLTHGWSRVVLDIGVAYKEDVDRVMHVITDVGKELRYDPSFRHLILEDLEMLGVDAFGDSAVMIKAIIKTRPLQQWTVKRAMMRRLKKKFDELGIEIPYPHRKIFHEYEPGSTPPGTPQQSVHTLTE